MRTLTYDEPLTSAPLQRELVWSSGALHLRFATPPDRPVSLQRMSAEGMPDATAARTAAFTKLRQPLHDQPLVELYADGLVHLRSGERLVESQLGSELRFLRSASWQSDGIATLEIVQAHSSGLEVTTRFTGATDVPACAVTTTVRNGSEAELVVTGVSTFAYGPPKSDLDVERSALSWARNEWLAEGRWTTERLRTSLLPDLDLGLHGQDPRAAFTLSQTGSWSTGRFLPAGVLSDPGSGVALAWQIDGAAGWTWEVGERRQGLYVLAQGPDDRRQQWRARLAPGESAESAQIAVSVSAEGVDGAIGALLQHRRATREPALLGPWPVVYNDYMNTLDGNPTTEALLPLVAAAAAVGADVFVIDAGWYDDGADWWDAVGAWVPSTNRFPDGGIERVIAAIRDAGMRPGLWLEPEVVGERSEMVNALPAEAFLHRNGAVVSEHGRRHLDLRHPAAVAHLDEVVDRLIDRLGVGYFKLDYNIDSGTGTDLASSSPGSGLQAVERARLEWIDRLRARHPGLLLENCASGAMRSDHASLARFDLQSTSDQQNPNRYPPIAAAAPAFIPPEQAANWAYPQPEMSDEEIVFTLVTGLAGRLYLSGFLDGMRPHQLALVRAAVDASREVCRTLARSTPSWPIGLPAWTASQAVVAFRTAGDDALVSIWNRDAEAPVLVLPFPHLAGRAVKVTSAFPAVLGGWTAEWDSAAAALTVRPTAGAPTARMLRLTDFGSADRAHRHGA